MWDMYNHLPLLHYSKLREVYLIGFTSLSQVQFGEHCFIQPSALDPSASDYIGQKES